MCVCAHAHNHSRIVPRDAGVQRSECVTYRRLVDLTPHCYSSPSCGANVLSFLGGDGVGWGRMNVVKGVLCSSLEHTNLKFTIEDEIGFDAICS